MSELILLAIKPQMRSDGILKQNDCQKERVVGCEELIA